MTDRRWITAWGHRWGRYWLSVDSSRPPHKCPFPWGGFGPHPVHGSLDPPELKSPNSTSIGSSASVRLAVVGRQFVADIWPCVSDMKALSDVAQIPRGIGGWVEWRRVCFPSRVSTGLQWRSTRPHLRDQLYHTNLPPKPRQRPNISHQYRDQYQYSCLAVGHHRNFGLQVEVKNKILVSRRAQASGLQTQTEIETRDPIFKISYDLS